QQIKIIFPIHPRTAARLDQFGGWSQFASLPNLQAIDPMGYIDFVKLMKESTFVMTDSGGMQEESTVLGVPCLTLRENTERPVTVSHGTNQLVGTATEMIVSKGLEIINGAFPVGRIPENWDGHAAERIVEEILKNSDKIKKLYHSVRQ